MSLVSWLGVILSLLLIAVPAAAAVLVGLQTSDRVRVLGLFGFGLLVVEGLLSAGWVLLGARLLNDTDVPLSVVTTGYSALQSLLAVGAIVLLALAIITGRQRAPIR